MHPVLPYRTPDGLIRGLTAAIIPSLIARAFIIALVSRIV